MARIDLWRWNATRVEIDHRAREARLRLEHLERLLITRALYRRGLGFFDGGRVLDRSAKVDRTGVRHREARHIPTGLCGLALAVRGAVGGTVGTAGPYWM